MIDSWSASRVDFIVCFFRFFLVHTPAVVCAAKLFSRNKWATCFLVATTEETFFRLGQLTRRSSFVGRRLAAHTLCSLEASVSPLLRRRLDGVVGALRDRVAVQVRGGEHLRSKGAVAARDGARDCAARDHFGRERCCACVRRRRHGRRSRDLRGHCASSAAGGPQLVRSVRGELLLGVVSRWRTPRILCLTRSPVAPSSFPRHHPPSPNNLKAEN